MKFNPARRRRGSLPASALEDFLFILVLALAVALSFYREANLSQQIALPNAALIAGALNTTELTNVPQVLMRTADDLQFEDATVADVDELLRRLGPPSQERDRLRFAAARTLEYGTVEDAKNALKAAGWNLLVVNQLQKE